MEDVSISKRYVHPSQETDLTALSRVPQGLSGEEADQKAASQKVGRDQDAASQSRARGLLQFPLQSQ